MTEISSDFSTGYSGQLFIKLFGWFLDVMIFGRVYRSWLVIFYNIDTYSIGVLDGKMAVAPRLVAQL